MVRPGELPVVLHLLHQHVGLVSRLVVEARKRCFLGILAEVLGAHQKFLEGRILRQNPVVVYLQIHFVQIFSFYA